MAGEGGGFAAATDWVRSLGGRGAGRECVPLDEGGGFFMDCPFCGKEMESGWVYSRGPLLWSPKQGKASLFRGREDISLMKEGPEGFSPGHPAAYICKDCRKVVVEY